MCVIIYQSKSGRDAVYQKTVKHGAEARIFYEKSFVGHVKDTTD